MRNVIFVLIIILVISLGYFLLKGSVHRYPLPKVAASVDLKKYAGTWYEIGLIPNKYERGCSCTKAFYKLMNGYIKVENHCYRKAEKKLDIVTGKAWATDKSNSKLKLQYSWPFRADYWIIYVDKNYKYALIGVPSRRFLWILARKSKMPAAEYDKLISIAAREGFDTSKMVKTVYDCQS